MTSALSVERLAQMPLGELRARLGLAHTGFLYAAVPIERERARRDAEELRAELERRGYAGMTA